MTPFDLPKSNYRLGDNPGGWANITNHAPDTTACFLSVVVKDLVIEYVRRCFGLGRNPATAKPRVIIRDDVIRNDGCARVGDDDPRARHSEVMRDGVASDND